MSHDQRPGKIRVVAAEPEGRRRGDAPSGPEIPPPPTRAKFPLVETGLFLVACAVGGVAIGIVRPMLGG